MKSMKIRLFRIPHCNLLFFFHTVLKGSDIARELQNMFWVDSATVDAHLTFLKHRSLSSWLTAQGSWLIAHGEEGGARALTGTPGFFLGHEL